MPHSQEKLVLSGGSVSKNTLDAAIELSGSEHPKIVIDTSPKGTMKDFEQSVSDVTRFFELNKLNTPLFLKAEFGNKSSENQKIDLLFQADILMVTGGSTRRAYRSWQNAGIANTIKELIESGEVVGYGASAGAMIWYENGYSDSLKYEAAPDSIWEYCAVKGIGIIPAWVTAHYGDTDSFHRDRAEGFSNFLLEHSNAWNTGIGIESSAAIVSVAGISKVIDARGDGAQSSNVYVYRNGPSISQQTYGVGDTFSV